MRRVEYRRGESPLVLADIEAGSVDAIVTDPPYGTGKPSAIYGRRRVGRASAIANDTDLSVLEAAAPWFAKWLSLNGVLLCCCAPQRRRTAEEIIAAGGLEPLHVISWDKGRPGISCRLRYSHEDIILAAHVGVDPWAEKAREPFISPVREQPVLQTEHPNEKPVALYRRLIRWAFAKRRACA